MRKRIIIVNALLGITVAMVYGLFLSDMAAARARIAGRSETISTPFGTMEYSSLGQGEPLLVIHGAAGGFDQGLDVAGPLANDGFRLIAPSRFGYLGSAMPAGLTNSMQADAYVALLDRLGVQKADVIGISAGAWSALQFAIRHPDRCRALVLFAPAPYLPPQKQGARLDFVRTMFSSDFISWATLKLLPVLPASVTRMILGTDPAAVRAAEPSERARVQQLVDHILPMSLRARGMEFDIKSATTQEPYAINKISCPVLTISATDDYFGTASWAKAIASGVPNGRSVIYPQGGHALAGDYKNVERQVVSFLKTSQK